MFPPLLEYHQAALSFQIPHKSRNAHFGRDTHKQMNMIRTYFSLYNLYSFPFAQLPQYISNLQPLVFKNTFLLYFGANTI